MRCAASSVQHSTIRPAISPLGLRLKSRSAVTIFKTHFRINQWRPRQCMYSRWAFPNLRRGQVYRVHYRRARLRARASSRPRLGPRGKERRLPRAFGRISPESGMVSSFLFRQSADGELAQASGGKAGRACGPTERREGLPLRSVCAVLVSRSWERTQCSKLWASPSWH